MLATVAGQPLWVTWRQGNGRVMASLGMPYGPESDAFWNQPGWPDPAATMIRQGASDG